MTCEEITQTTPARDVLQGCDVIDTRAHTFPHGDAGFRAFCASGVFLAFLIQVDHKEAVSEGEAHGYKDKQYDQGKQERRVTHRVGHVVSQHVARALGQPAAGKHGVRSHGGLLCCQGKTAWPALR